VAVAAFVLATARDEFVRYRQRRDKDRATLAAIAEEVAANIRTAENNRNLVRHELQQLIPNGERILNPLDPLELGFWEIVKIDPPQALIHDTPALASIREVARLAGQVNQMLQSREAFRVASPTLTMHTREGAPSWARELAGYDQLLDRFLGELLDALHRVQPAVRAWQRHT
jgi:hypothetical protein